MTLQPTTDAVPGVAEKLRNAARWSLYLALLLVLGVGTLLYFSLRDQFIIAVDPWYGVDFLDYQEVRELQAIVRIDSTHETGREIDVAHWLQEQLASFGVPAAIEDMGNGKANLVARIDGTSHEVLVLHSHMDTDPVGDLGQWLADPWSAHIEVVWLYGRGSFDMKSTIVAQLQAMRSVQHEIKRTGQRPRRGLVMLSTSSEETGSHEGAQHIVNQRPEVLEGAWALFSEGGVVEAVDENAVKYLGISFGQKRFVDTWYSSASLESLEDLHDRFTGRNENQPLRVTEPVRDFLAVYSPTRQLAEVRVLADPDALIADPVAFAALPDYYKGLFRDELHVFRPEPDLSNPGSFRMRTVLHLLPGTDIEDAADRLLPRPEDLPDGLTVISDPSVGSETTSPLDHPAFIKLVEQLRTELPGATVGPYYLFVAANDAQFFRKLGIPSYGFQPFLSVPADSYTVSRANERIALPTFIEGVQRYARIVQTLIE